jgi:hypothetical protein
MHGILEKTKLFGQEDLTVFVGSLEILALNYLVYQIFLLE